MYVIVNLDCWEGGVVICTTIILDNILTFYMCDCLMFESLDKKFLVYTKLIILFSLMFIWLMILS